MENLTDEEKIMKKLNDYLYSGDTVLKILQRYAKDLKQSAKETDNQIDLLHCNVLLQIAELLQHNEFLTSQSQRIREFYKPVSYTHLTLPTNREV